MIRLAFCLATIASASAVPVDAQAGPTQTPTWAGESAVIISNAVAGGLTAGIRQALSGGSFGKGFLWGAAGGTVGYLGKRVASTGIDGAGFLGREVAAVGHSMVRNASDGRTALSRLYLPLGPVPAWVAFAPGGGSGPTLRLDAVSLGTLVALSTDSSLRFDFNRTLSAGAPAFEAMRRQIKGPDGTSVAGVMFHSNIVVADYRFFGDGVDRTLVHETIHVIQQDFALLALSDPLNQSLFDVLGLGVVDRFLMFNEVAWAGYVVNDWLTDRDGSDSPLEREAGWLAR